MIGTVAQLVTLAAYGNAYLRIGYINEDYDQSNSTFQFCKRIHFKELLDGKPSSKSLAESPSAWFRYLRERNCQCLRLYYDLENIKNNQRTAGLINSAGTWYLEALYSDHSDFWLADWQVGDQKAEDQKVWLVDYILVAPNKTSINLQFRPEDVRKELNEVLPEIAAFASSQKLQNWVAVFLAAKDTLTKENPEADYYHKDLLPEQYYWLEYQQLIFAAGTAWVFGAMGSWNDLIFDDPKTEKQYNELSAKLYKAIIKTIIAAVNTG